MKKVYYLSSCDTCMRILNEIKLSDEFVFQDIKHEPITEEQLDFLKNEVGRYELLFNKRSKLYKERQLQNQNLTEEDYKKLILEHYTFLKRPIIIMNNRVIAGNATKIIKEYRKLLA